MSSNRKSKKPERKINPSVLRNAMLRRLPRQLRAQGEIALPAVPALLEHYVQLFATVFSALGRPLAGDELTHLRTLLSDKLSEAFAGSPFSKVVVRYETDPLPKTTLTYWVSIISSSIADEYAQ